MESEYKRLEEDFIKSFNDFSEKIVLYLKRFVGRNDAEDLMQEVFIKAYNSLSSFNGNSKLSTWIYKIATNTALDKLKSHQYRKEKSVISSIEYINQLKDNRPSQDEYGTEIEYTLLKKEMNQCIADFISRLPDNYRTVFLLREYENFSFDEIAEVTDMTKENVKIRLHRAKKKLHELLLSGCSFYYDEYSNLCCDRK